MPYIFKNRNSIRKIYRILTELDQTTENFTDICQVEITRHNKVLGPPVIFTAYRMNIVNIIISVGAVSQMTQINITGKGNIFLYELRILKTIRVRPGQCVKILIDESEYFFYRICLVRSLSENVPVTGRNI